jgi:hypothetical protein
MFRNSLYWILLAAVALLPCGSRGEQSSAPGGFTVFDGLLYRNKPDLTSVGMPRIIQVNQPQGYGGPIDDAKVRATLATLRDFHGVVFLDYETWELNGPPAVVAENVAKYNHVAQIAHESVPNALFGYYGMIPCREYWGLVNQDRDKIRAWKECNREGENIAGHVDVIFPSLYTFYNDQKSWDIYARGMIEEARRYHKPVYVFLWPEFHVSNPLLKGTNIPAQFWRHQLDFCRGLADGIVIWGGWQEEWQEDAPWWVETKAFLATLNRR